MKVLVGLAATTAVLAGCGTSSGEYTESTVAFTEPTVTQTPDGPVTTLTIVEQQQVIDTTGAQSTDLPGPPAPQQLTVTAGNLGDARVVSENTVTVGTVSNATFVPEDPEDPFDEDILFVQVPFDGDDSLQQYLNAGTLNGYSVFTMQDDPLDRAFTAFARESDDGLLQAVLVFDGGQFNTAFGGGVINQESYTAVTNGLASYAGDYVGLTNIGPGLFTGNGASADVVPGATSDVTGRVFMNVDFAESQVNGSVYDREMVLNGVTYELQPINLLANEIDENGQFTGRIQFSDLTAVGEYTGALGGNGTPSIAGIVALGEGFLEGATVNSTVTTLFDDVEGEAEYGLFLLGQCPAGGAACFDSN